MATKKRVRKTIIETLTVQLTDDERNHAGRQLADAEMRRMRRKELYELERSRWKDDDKALEEECKRYARMAYSGVEDRDVEVVVEYDYQTATVSFTRMDTGEVARPPRVMTLEERQMPLEPDDDVTH
jgi:hypothetical protein